MNFSFLIYENGDIFLEVLLEHENQVRTWAGSTAASQESALSCQLVGLFPQHPASPSSQSPSLTGHTLPCPGLPLDGLSPWPVLAGSWDGVRNFINI